MGLLKFHDAQGQDNHERKTKRRRINRLKNRLLLYAQSHRR